MICSLKLMLGDYRQQKHGKLELQSASPIHYGTLKYWVIEQSETARNPVLVQISPKPTNN